MSARSDALAALIERAEADRLHGQDAFDLRWGAFPDHGADLLRAMEGSIDPIARIEAPLRARGWHSWVEGNGDGAFYAELSLAGRKVFGRSTSEARARLLAVLRALLVEEGQ